MKTKVVFFGPPDERKSLFTEDNANKRKEDKQKLLRRKQYALFFSGQEKVR